MNLPKGHVYFYPLKNSGCYVSQEGEETWSFSEASHALHRIETWSELVEALKTALDCVSDGEYPVTHGILKAALTKAEKGA